MSSRPRPSLLALFDPLCTSPSRSLPPCSSISTADSNPKKENVVTTPGGCGPGEAQCNEICSETVFFKRTYSRNKFVDAQSCSTEESFSFHPGMLVNTSNLCLVQLGDDCDVSRDEMGINGGMGARKPLTEKTATSNWMTPRTMVLGKQLASPGTPSGRSALKFANGVSKFDPSTPTARLEVAQMKKLGIYATSSPTITVANFRGEDKLPTTRPSSTLPGKSTFGEKTQDSSPAVHNESSTVIGGSSFDIHCSLGVKKNSPHSDLLAEELSFLARMSDDSILDNNGKGISERPKKQASCASKPVDLDREEVGLLRRKSSVSYSPTSSLPPSSPLSSGSDGESEEQMVDPGAEEAGFCTPTSSPLKREDIMQNKALAPKKSQYTIGGKVGSLEKTVALEPPKAKHDRRLSRSITESSLPPRKGQMLPPIADKNDSMGTKVQRSHISQGARSSMVGLKPALDRRLSIGKDLLSQSVTGRANNEVVEPKGRPSLFANRLNTQENGRTAGPRRVPIVSGAPLLSQGQSRLGSASTVDAPIAAARSGPQRPPQGHRLASSVSSLGTITKFSFTARSLSRGSTLAEATKSALMKTAGAASSRLPMPQTKAASRLPAPASKKAF